MFQNNSSPIGRLIDTSTAVSNTTDNNEEVFKFLLLENFHICCLNCLYTWAVVSDKQTFYNYILRHIYIHLWSILLIEITFEPYILWMKYYFGSKQIYNFIGNILLIVKNGITSALKSYFILCACLINTYFWYSLGLRHQSRAVTFGEYRSAYRASCSPVRICNYAVFMTDIFLSINH